MRQVKRIGQTSSTGRRGIWGRRPPEAFKRLSPSVGMGVASRKPSKQGPGRATTLINDVVQAFTDRTARVLLLEGHQNQLRSTEWGQAVVPALMEAAYTVETV